MHTGESSPPQAIADVLNEFTDLSDMANGEVALVVELMDLFLEQTPELMMELKEAVTRGDWHAIRTISHTLKPTFKYLEMDQSYSIANSLEQCHEQDPNCRNEVHLMMNRLIEEVSQGLNRVTEAVGILKTAG